MILFIISLCINSISLEARSVMSNLCTEMRLIIHPFIIYRRVEKYINRFGNRQRLNIMGLNIMGSGEWGSQVIQKRTTKDIYHVIPSSVMVMIRNVYSLLTPARQTLTMKIIYLYTHRFTMVQLRIKGKKVINRIDMVVCTIYYKDSLLLRDKRCKWD